MHVERGWAGSACEGGPGTSVSGTGVCGGTGLRK